MQKLLQSIVAVLFVVGASTASHGLLLTYTGSISVGIGTIPPVSLAGGGVATINGSGGGPHISDLDLAQGAFAGTAATPVFNASPISGLLVAGGTVTQMFMAMAATFTFVYPTGSASNATGSFGNISAGPPGGGVMALNGVVLVCLFAGGGGAALGCGGTPASNLVVPLSPIGQGGSAFATAGVNITAFGAPWTIGTAAVQASTVMGFAHDPGSATSSTAAPSGVVQLVTPVFVSTNLGAFPTVAVFANLTLHFVPEPGTLLLLGAGIAGLAVLGRRRMSN